jgi:hypothetical protein
MARAKSPARGTTTDEASTKVEDAVQAEMEDVSRVEDAALVAIETPVELAGADSGQDAALVVAAVEVPATDSGGSHEEPTASPVAAAPDAKAASVHTIVAEVSDYTTRSLENRSAFMRRLVGARSFESAIQIQSEYAKTCYIDFVACLLNIGKLYSKVAVVAFQGRSHVA